MTKTHKLAFALLVVPFILFIPLVARWFLSPNLAVVYAESNARYFNNELPTTTVLDWNEHEDGTVASTQFDGERFHLSFNRAYANEIQIEDVKHEMCHIATWDEVEDHGPRWQECMARAK